MSNIPANIEASDIKLIAPAKYVIAELLNFCVKAVTLGSTTLDPVQSCVNTAKVYATAMEKSAVVSTAMQHAELELALNKQLEKAKTTQS